jgi:transcriptional regulator with XRE-family HTH domain
MRFALVCKYDEWYHNRTKAFNDGGCIFCFAGAKVRAVHTRIGSVTVDRRYFDSLMQAKDLSLRGLAKRMGMSHSQLSLVFSGDRRMQLDEAAQLSSIFSEPLHRIVEAAGVAVLNTGAHRIFVIGAMQGDGTVALHPEGVIERTVAPEGMGDDSVAIQARTAGSPWDWLDGAVFFCSKPSGVDGAALGRFCYCKIKDGPAVMAGVRRGYLPGTHNLRGPYNADSVNLVSATAIVFTRN